MRTSAGSAARADVGRIVRIAGIVVRRDHAGVACAVDGQRLGDGVPGEAERIEDRVLQHRPRNIDLDLGDHLGVCVGLFQLLDWFRFRSKFQRIYLLFRQKK